MLHACTLGSKSDLTCRPSSKVIYYHSCVTILDSRHCSHNCGRDEIQPTSTTTSGCAQKRGLPEVESTGKLSAGFVQRRRAEYDTAAATGLQRNNTVTRPLEHMITESDVPDYAELQRHHGHREKMYSVNALLNPMPCINFMQISCISSRKHIQMI